MWITLVRRLKELNMQRLNGDPREAFIIYLTWIAQAVASLWESKGYLLVHWLQRCEGV